MFARGNGNVSTTALTLTAFNVALATAFATMARHAHQPGFTLPRLAGFTLGFCIVGLFPMRLEFGRHQVTFTLTDSVLVTAVFAMGPVGVGLAAAIGEALSCGAHRVPLLKTMFNTANRLGAATIAGTAFYALGGSSRSDLHAWSVALLAAACFAVLNIGTVAGVLARAEGRRYEEIFYRSAPTALGTTLAAAPLGLIVIDLFGHSAAAPLLLGPVVVAVALNNRYAAAQRDEHLRIERLYEATSRAARLTTFGEAVASVADESRRLLTGMAAICCAPNASGELVGVVADDTGAYFRTGTGAGELIALAAATGPTEVSPSELPASVRGLAPNATRVVLAQSPPESPVPVTIAVFRGSALKDSRLGQLETLTAFAAQGSLTIGNARLYEEVGEALRLQVDLTRQKTDFVAAVSHELRTPLAAMLGAVQTTLRLKDRISPEDRERFLRMSLDQGGRLKRLIEDLLLVAAAEHRNDVCVRMRVDVGALFDGIAHELAAVIEGRLVIDVTAADVFSDEHRLHQILVNLVGNAAKYAPSGPIGLQASVADGELTIRVVDHGPGIAPADRARIFDRFVQLDQSSTRRQGGTGLGLFLSRQLADQLDGSLTMSETAGGGCTFTLTVPATSEAGEGTGDDVAVPSRYASLAPSGPFQGGRS